MKHPQYIIAADAKIFDTTELDQCGITAIDAVQFFEHVQGHVVLRRRHELDQPDTVLPYRQFLPYDIFSRIGRDFKRSFFAYRRKPSAGEPELHGKVSIGIGGHVDAVNAVWFDDGSLDLVTTLAKSSLGEKVEELDILIGDIKVPEIHKKEMFPQWAPKLVDTVSILLDNSDNVGKRHFAIVSNNIVPEGTVLACAEDELETLGFLTHEELTATTEAGEPVYNLEGWTKICLEHFRKAVTAKTKLSISGATETGAYKELVQEAVDVEVSSAVSSNANVKLSQKSAPAGE